jgi:hypothetical protein
MGRPSMALNAFLLFWSVQIVAAEVDVTVANKCFAAQSFPFGHNSRLASDSSRCVVTSIEVPLTLCDETVLFRAKVQALVGNGEHWKSRPRP